jgi:hypothetical protein
MRWAGLVAFMGEGRIVYRVLVGDTRNKLFLMEIGCWGCARFTWPRVGNVGGLLSMRCSNDGSGTMELLCKLLHNFENKLILTNQKELMVEECSSHSRGMKCIRFSIKYRIY